jgi:hypothetical protein
MKGQHVVTRATSIAAAVIALTVWMPPAAIALETAAGSATPGAAVPQSSDELVDAPGRERAAQCGACHSLDYIRMNSRFLDHAGWTAVVNKMINVYGAPIATADVEAIAAYLTTNYGRTD